MPKRITQHTTSAYTTKFGGKARAVAPNKSRMWRAKHIRHTSTSRPKNTTRVCSRGILLRGDVPDRVDCSLLVEQRLILKLAELQQKYSD